MSNNSPDNIERELTTKEAAELLGLSPSTLRKWRCTGERPELPWCKRFRKVFYLESEVIIFKEKNTTSNYEETYV
ncbi:helix-turn-helix domain-containing protein [uncultured Paraglaciecola sp.]|uniref:helix-turn-helix domain-containing protein n=1 Tax=uncultured Paraglaciecola sp. TaxID=1765024 RepID=UPI002622942E|nr:helix-turn-helix domain-containing protein [uncultured Paraglaciecola sp.]